MRLPVLSTVAGLVLGLAAASALAQKTQLLVYTALETDQLKAYQEGFNKAHPDIDIKWVRDSTGVITAKLLAEKANPQADAVMGVAASTLLKQTVAPNTFMPHQAGTFFLSRYWLMMASRFSGA